MDLSSFLFNYIFPFYCRLFSCLLICFPFSFLCTDFPLPCHLDVSSIYRLFPSLAHDISSPFDITHVLFLYIVFLLSFTLFHIHIHLNFFLSLFLTCYLSISSICRRFPLSCHHDISPIYRLFHLSCHLDIFPYM